MIMNHSDVLKTDILVAGGGIAGYKAAVTAAKKGLEVLLVTKNTVTASEFVLGFNAVLSSEDSAQLYAEDTMSGGGNINNPDLVNVLATQSAVQVEETEAMGLEFDRADGEYDLMKPLGCTVPRLAHIKNYTGRLSLEKLREEAGRLGVKIQTNIMLADVCVADGRVTGAVLYDLENKDVINVQTKAVVIATGGIHITDDSTYPVCMTGDGYGVAYRAGAQLTDMEFLQFEPCRCIYPKKLGISTTLLAKGGIITNSDGERFLLSSYASEGDIPKNELAKLIYREIKAGKGTAHGGVYLDLTDVPREEIVEKHSLYYKRFMDAGIDITKEKIEVAPCPHSFMGGVVIDTDCSAAVDGMYVAGEAAGGIHGANRVGGNAGTEIYVFGKIAGESAAEYASKADFELSQYPCDSGDYDADCQYFKGVKEKIYKIMSDYMGPVRDAYGLVAADELLTGLCNDVSGARARDFNALVVKKECENMLTVCMCACRAAIDRRESRGAHFRIDYPEKCYEYTRNFVHKK